MRRKPRASRASWSSPRLNKRPRAAAAMTISPAQYDVPLLPPRIGVACADPAGVRLVRGRRPNGRTGRTVLALGGLPACCLISEDDDLAPDETPAVITEIWRATLSIPVRLVKAARRERARFRRVQRVRAADSVIEDASDVPEALIRAGREALMVHSMFYANEVGQAPYRVEDNESNAKELELAKMLVGALEAKFEPEKWKDRYEERLKALIESRIPVAAAGAPEHGPGQAPAADIMEALRKSLEMARKPMAREQEPARPRRQPARRK